MFCIAYDTTCYADLQRAFNSFVRQLWEFFYPRSASGKTCGLSHTRSRTGLASTTRRICGLDPHPHLPRDRLQEYHSEPETPPEGSCSRADEAQDDSDTDNTDEGDHLCLTG